MKQKVTGLKLNISSKGEVTGTIQGKKILPHRIDLIRKYMDAGKLEGLEDLFFNFNVPGHLTSLTWQQVQEESNLFDKFCKLIGE